MIIAAAPRLDQVEVFRRVCTGQRPFFLDSGSDADGLGRFSFAGCDPDREVAWRIGERGDPYALVEGLSREVAQVRDAGVLPEWIGFLSYDLGASELARRCGRVLQPKTGGPDLDFAHYPALWRFDRRTECAEIVACDQAAAARLRDRLSHAPAPLAPLRVGDPRWELSPDDYRDRVRRVLDYLRAGDVYQVNLSHRLRVAVDQKSAIALYLRLRQVAPAPLASFLQTKDCTILSNSPELLLRTCGPSIETRPIKGTRPRALDHCDDAHLGQALLDSKKEQAEHLMIVDLERNDLGRIAEVGSVQVEDFARLVSFPTVHHLVSTVRARLRPEIGLAQIFAAMFPGGSITGAPKLRAVEIIDELEQSWRGVYCGALGWIGSDAGEPAIEFALPIRTATLHDGELIVPVGGGIVADSTPDGELEETRIKAIAFLRALQD